MPHSEPPPRVSSCTLGHWEQGLGRVWPPRVSWDQWEGASPPVPGCGTPSSPQVCAGLSSCLTLSALSLSVPVPQEIRQLQQKQASYIREISDLQETIEWKDKKIGVGSPVSENLFQRAVCLASVLLRDPWCARGGVRMQPRGTHAQSCGENSSSPQLIVAPNWKRASAWRVALAG